MDSRYLIIFLTIVSTRAFPDFATKIPNGESVPHPCKPNYIWQGVGHKNKNGGGERNPFGIDFYNAGKTWTHSLCSKDSDGDGLTNGEELGDPNCHWSEGSLPEKLTGLSHPGVCEPMNSIKCQGKNDWVDCSADEFKCEALQNDPGCRNQTIRFPRTRVPANETNYFCMGFGFVQDGDYHMIATEPLIDNLNVMHHIAIFGCTQRPNIPVNMAAPCGMDLGDCNDIIGGWTVGATGECFHDHIGFRIGQNGYKYGILQFHWNNPQLRSDYTDESGIIIHYTSNRRVYDAGVLTIGNMYIEIPPQSEQVTVEAHCESLDVVDGPVYITRALNHMHYLGRKMNTEHYRNGVKLRYLTQEDNYRYDSPKYFRYKDAIQLIPGDSLKTTCVYRSKSRSKTVFYGDGTNEEMCFGIITYYPKERIKIRNCINWKKLDLAAIYASEEIHQCRHWDFLLSSTAEIKSLKSRILENCKELTSCLSECLTVVNEIQQHPCMVGDIGDWIKEEVRVGKDPRINYSEMRAFYFAISTCDTRIQQEKCLPVSSSSTRLLSFTNLSVFITYISFIVFIKVTT